MKRVIIVAPDFSPSSLPPALRVRFFARHLPSFGWEPIILSSDPSYYDWSIDAENNALIPKGTRVVRTRALPSRLTHRIGLGCIGMRSLWYHWRALKQLCVSEKPDLLFIPVPPYVPMLLGRLIHDRFHVPYVVDYIDPWVTEYYWRLPRSQRPPKWFLADLLSRTVEPFALREVADIVGVSRGTTEDVIRRYPWLSASQGREIPYGGEPEDVEYLRQHPRRQSIFQKGDGLIHISYVGRGGTDLKQALSAVFRAFHDGLKVSPELFQQVRLHFVGTSYAPDATGQYQVLPLAEECGLRGYVTEAPARVAYLEALQVLLDSDALLAVGSDAPHYTASKIFPYIMARRPLLAVFHRMSSVVTILRETNTGSVVTFDETKPEAELGDEVGAALRDLIVSTKGFSPATNWQQFSQYTTEAMTARLADVFDRAVAQNGVGYPVAQSA